ncbi:MAG: ACT domain-containing protein, partial [Candidatus Omnitrophica bacterium]|nr:ACT domain-containing protein [Candidatus Omnitrophota bacterium]
IAKDRGIKINETKTRDIENYANAITVEVATKKTKSEAMGTLFTKDDPRIVKLWDFHVDAVPSGYMLVISNIDKPGIVGQIGSILGQNNINIAGMNFGREKPGGRAVTVLNIDSPVPEGVLNEIKSAKNITDAKVIKL